MPRESAIRVDDALLESIRRRRDEAGSRFPRLALFLFDCPDAESLGRLLQRIPPPVEQWLEELVVMRGAEHAVGAQAAWPAVSRFPQLRFHRAPRQQGHGAARKAAFEYARLRGFDAAITMRGDGSQPPEVLPALIDASLREPRRLVLASRLHRLVQRGAGTSLARRLAHRLATGFQNRALGLRLDDYHSSYRLYPVALLRAIPFQLDANDRVFEMQILIQCRALGLPIDELRVPPVWQEYPTGWSGLLSVLRACATVVDYRLHQLHFTRRGRYFVDRAVHYTLKHSPSGSHMQLVSAIRPGSSVLDLGCSQGLLARPLREKGVRVTGVDVREPDRLCEELATYHRRDLEQPLELPEGRAFDYVVVSDVIEHVRNRVQLLTNARRFLKPGGRLLISTPNIAIWFYRLSLLLGRFEYGPRGVLDETHVHLFTRATFRREVERAGFHLLRERTTSLPFEVVFESTGRSRLIRGLAAAYWRLTRLWPTLFAYQFILEAEITTLDEESTV